MKYLAPLAIFVSTVCAAVAGEVPAWEKANPIKPLPKPPLGVDRTFDELKTPPTPQTVRLGRWLYYDTRLSADNTNSCASCHKPEYGFSELTPVSTGIKGQKGTRKAPSFINEAWTIYPVFFWDGRAASLEEQALGPIANPIEMGNTHTAMIDALTRIKSYGTYFEQAFGSPKITKDRVAKAIADYERTRMSGNSPFDRWQEARYEEGGAKDILAPQAVKGYELFHGKAQCNQCHLGFNFTDSKFHNLGIGWDAAAKKFKDPGRYAITKNTDEMGAFKTPGLREVTKHPPYMHDGSIKTLREVVAHYNKGGNPNPHLSKKIHPLNLTDKQIDAIVAFMKALDGEGYMDKAPAAFPQ